MVTVVILQYVQLTMTYAPGRVESCAFRGTVRVALRRLVENILPFSEMRFSLVGAPHVELPISANRFALRVLPGLNEYFYSFISYCIQCYQWYGIGPSSC